jgi:hypothetical protein
MQRLFVDFGRGIGDGIDILTTAHPNELVTLHENERVILYDSSLEVQGVLREVRAPDGHSYWVALPDWATQRDLV